MPAPAARGSRCIFFSHFAAATATCTVGYRFTVLWFSSVLWLRLPAHLHTLPAHYAHVYRSGSTRFTCAFMRYARTVTCGLRLRFPAYRLVTARHGYSSARLVAFTHCWLHTVLVVRLRLLLHAAHSWLPTTVTVTLDYAFPVYGYLPLHTFCSTPPAVVTTPHDTAPFTATHHSCYTLLRLLRFWLRLHVLRLHTVTRLRSAVLTHVYTFALRSLPVRSTVTTLPAFTGLPAVAFTRVGSATYSCGYGLLRAVVLRLVGLHTRITFTFVTRYITALPYCRSGLRIHAVTRSLRARGCTYAFAVTTHTPLPRAVVTPRFTFCGSAYAVGYVTRYVLPHSPHGYRLLHHTHYLYTGCVPRGYFTPRGSAYLYRLRFHLRTFTVRTHCGCVPHAVAFVWLHCARFVAVTLRLVTATHRVLVYRYHGHTHAHVRVATRFVTYVAVGYARLHVRFFGYAHVWLPRSIRFVHVALIYVYTHSSAGWLRFPFCLLHLPFAVVHRGYLPILVHGCVLHTPARPVLPIRLVRTFTVYRSVITCRLPRSTLRFGYLHTHVCGCHIATVYRFTGWLVAGYGLRLRLPQLHIYRVRLPLPAFCLLRLHLCLFTLVVPVRMPVPLRTFTLPFGYSGCGYVYALVGCCTVLCRLRGVLHVPPLRVRLLPGYVWFRFTAHVTARFGYGYMRSRLRYRYVLRVVVVPQLPRPLLVRVWLTALRFAPRLRICLHTYHCLRSVAYRGYCTCRLCRAVTPVVPGLHVTVPGYLPTVTFCVRFTRLPLPFSSPVLRSHRATAFGYPVTAFTPATVPPYTRLGYCGCCRTVPFLVTQLRLPTHRTLRILPCHTGLVVPRYARLLATVVHHGYTRLRRVCTVGLPRIAVTFYRITVRPVCGYRYTAAHAVGCRLRSHAPLPSLLRLRLLRIRGCTTFGLHFTVWLFWLRCLPV